jgi:predicted anti-sigma-YlaC factor YlaD
MKPDVHVQAKELIALGQEPGQAQPSWLRAHLQECAACRGYAEAAGRAVRALRSQPFATDSALVRATQMRVHSRALELQRRQERLWVVCVCCAALTLGTAFTTVVMWRGFAWVGQQWRLPDAVWQIAIVAFALLPAIVAAILLLARGTYLADQNVPLQN